jgi:hypothetical protein
MFPCGIINELAKLTTSAVNMSFFVCQATQAHINNATAVLRGLISMLVEQQSLLIALVRLKYDHVGKRLFQDVNAWVALSEILIDLLEEENLQKTYLVIDALGECPEDLHLLLEPVIRTSLAHSGAKWIVSCRNWPSIGERLDTAQGKK